MSPRPESRERAPRSPSQMREERKQWKNRGEKEKNTFDKGQRRSPSPSKNYHATEEDEKEGKEEEKKDDKNNVDDDKCVESSFFNRLNNNNANNQSF